MAERAGQIAMRTVADKSRHGVVLELGRSLFWSVALVTVPAELAAMRLSLRMTVHALDLAQLVATVDVAGLALGGLVQTFEWELLVLPDETQVLEMLGRRVAFATVTAKLPIVFVFVFVTVETGELVGAVDPVLVAVLALAAHLGLGVKANQGEAGILVVTKGPRARAAFHVATGARLVGELPLVCGPMLVTGDASALRVGDLRALAVAFAAIQALVLAEKGKSESTVVDFGLFPGMPGKVAGRTLGSLGVHWVEGTVAVGTLAGWGAACHRGFGVALGTWLFEVLAVKGDPRVAPVRFQPSGQQHAAQDVTRGMAGVALLRERGLSEPMHALVATSAVGRKAEIGDATRFHSPGVAGGAGNLGVVVD
jgi:hypothetical protein